MTSSDAASAATPQACSACGAALDALGRCRKCGAVFGEAHRCPLCQALSDIEADATLVYRCRSCGGPRLPAIGKPPSEPEIAALKQARGEQLRALTYRAGAGFAFASSALSFVVTSVVLLATSPAPFAKFAALFACFVPALVALFALRKAGAHRRALRASLDQAWLLGASRAVAERGPLNAQALAQTLRIDEARAELLLAEISVRDFVRDRPDDFEKVRVAELEDRELPAEPARAGAAAVGSKH